MSELSWMSAVREAICLSLGQSTSSNPDWSLVFDVARAERLLGIAWLKSGPRIRSTAPTDIVAAWRAAAVEQDARARTQLETLVDLDRLLAARGVRPMVLKGPPLSTRLYGEQGARHSVDVDLLIPEKLRQATRAVLEVHGWTKWLGRAPWDECFYRRCGDTVEYLEVHSRLPGEALSHCGPLHLERETFTCAAGRLDIAAGDGFAVYLAGNMAKHGVLPLSVIVDFHALWSSTTVSARTAIIESARVARLSRCLMWVLQQIKILVDAADGRKDALENLGVVANGRVFEHALLRLVRLADRPSDAARIAAAWMWPRVSRDSWRGFGTVWTRRLRKSWGKAGTFSQGYVRS